MIYTSDGPHGTVWMMARPDAAQEAFAAIEKVTEPVVITGDGFTVMLFPPPNEEEGGPTTTGAA